MNPNSFDRCAAAHVLRRVGFGAPSEAVDAAVRAGLAGTLDGLFAQRAHPAEARRGLDGLLSVGDLEPLQAHGMATLLADSAPLVERVALMWHGHFATSHAKVRDVRLMHRQFELFRTLGLGDFRELLTAVARDPAMLVWLDGVENRVGRPNENFAREVLELFALGVDAGYTERDVREAARAFSGFTVEGREAVFREARHDAGEKALFGRGGVRSADDAVRRVLDHPAAAPWVARRLLATFQAPAPTRAECEALGRVLSEEGWRIDATLRRLCEGPDFLAPHARRARIAGPVELIAHTCITLRCKVSPRDAARAAAAMGQALFLPPTVEGWPGGPKWIDSGTWLARHAFLVELAQSPERFDPRRAYGADTTAANVAERALALLLPGGAADTLRATLDAAVARAGSFDAAARDVTTLILTAPEFHVI